MIVGRTLPLLSLPAIDVKALRALFVMIVGRTLPLLSLPAIDVKALRALFVMIVMVVTNEMEMMKITSSF